MMVGGVDLHGRGADDLREQGAGLNDYGVTGLVAGVGLLVRKSAGNCVRDVLVETAAESDSEELLAAADAEHGHVTGESTSDEGEFGGGAGLLQGDFGMAIGFAVEHRVNIEGASGDDQGINPVEIGAGKDRIVRQGDR